MNLLTIHNDILLLILKKLPINNLLAGRLVCSTIRKSIDSIQFDELIKETHKFDEECIEVTYKISPTIHYRSITSILIGTLFYNDEFNYYGGMKKVGAYIILKLLTSISMGRERMYLYIKGSDVKHMIRVHEYNIISVISSNSYIDIWTFLLYCRMASPYPMNPLLYFNLPLGKKIGKLQLPDELYTTALDYLD